jgi:hypothetical protein
LYGKIPYILQYAAHEEKEYEIFYIRDAANNIWFFLQHYYLVSE